MMAGSFRNSGEDTGYSQLQTPRCHPNLFGGFALQQPQFQPTPSNWQKGRNGQDCRWRVVSGRKDRASARSRVQLISARMFMRVLPLLDGRPSRLECKNPFGPAPVQQLRPY
jgi:hypothetical protein